MAADIERQRRLDSLEEAADGSRYGTEAEVQSLVDEVSINRVQKEAGGGQISADSSMAENSYKEDNDIVLKILGESGRYQVGRFTFPAF